MVIKRSTWSSAHCACYCSRIHDASAAGKDIGLLGRDCETKDYSSGEEDVEEEGGEAKKKRKGKKEKARRMTPEEKQERQRQMVRKIRRSIDRKHWVARLRLISAGGAGTAGDGRQEAEAGRRR